MPWIELGLGTFFAWTVWYAVVTENYFTVPFLLLFVVGYWWAGFSTLWQEYQGRLRWQRERDLALDKTVA